MGLLSFLFLLMKKHEVYQPYRKGLRTRRYCLFVCLLYAYYYCSSVVSKSSHWVPDVPVHLQSKSMLHAKTGEIHGVLMWCFSLTKAGSGRIQNSRYCISYKQEILAKKKTINGRLGSLLN